MDRSMLAAQLESGRSIESIARELGRDPSTVAYCQQARPRLGVRGEARSPRRNRARAARAAGGGGVVDQGNRAAARRELRDRPALAEEARARDCAYAPQAPDAAPRR